MATSVFLGELEAKRLLAEEGFSVSMPYEVKNLDEALDVASKIGYPVVLKVASGKIVHKSDVGGVITGIDSAEKLKEVFDPFLKRMREIDPEASATIQKQYPPSVELVVGVFEDELFGKVMMFGLGGILVEVLKDVSFRLIPITEADALEMMDELKGSRILDGVRGYPKVDRNALSRFLVKVSEFAEKHNVTQMDLNPVFASGDEFIIVDARMEVCK